MVSKLQVNLKFWNHECVDTDLNYKITSKFLNHKLNLKITAGLVNAAYAYLQSKASIRYTEASFLALLLSKPWTL